MKSMDEKKKMIEQIVRTCLANNVHVSGDLFLSLCFRSDEALKKICKELSISENY